MGKLKSQPYTVVEPTGRENDNITNIPRKKGVRQTSTLGALQAIEDIKTSRDLEIMRQRDLVDRKMRQNELDPTSQPLFAGLSPENNSDDRYGKDTDVCKSDNYHCKQAVKPNYDSKASRARFNADVRTLITNYDTLVKKGIITRARLQQVRDLDSRADMLAIYETRIYPQMIALRPRIDSVSTATLEMVAGKVIEVDGILNSLLTHIQKTIDAQAITQTLGEITTEDDEITAFLYSQV